MKLDKEDAFDVLDNTDCHLLKREVGRTRWANEYELVFKRDGKIWSFVYRMGTGDDGELPFQHVDDVECVEMESYEKTVTAYRVKR